VLTRLGFDANNVQLDDGWQKAWGDWPANAKFPQGLDGFASALDAKGLHAGVWLVPFLVDETAPVATAHPEWLLTDEKGRRIARRDFFTGATQLALKETALLRKTATLPALARLAEPGTGLEPLDAPG
jgi:alpha-galactosidase